MSDVSGIDDAKLQLIAEQLGRVFGEIILAMSDNACRDMIALHAMRLQIEDDSILGEAEPEVMAKLAYDMGDAFAAERAHRRFIRQREGKETRQ
jgi:hypothetical protein